MVKDLDVTTTGIGARTHDIGRTKEVSEEENQGIKLTCSKCGYSWLYNGESKFRATCPRCGNKIRIKDLSVHLPTQEGL